MSMWLDRIEAKKSEEQYKKDKRARDHKVRKNNRIERSNVKAEADSKRKTFAPYQDKVAAAKRKVKKKQKAADRRSYYGG